MWDDDDFTYDQDDPELDENGLIVEDGLSYYDTNYDDDNEGDDDDDDDDDNENNNETKKKKEQSVKKRLHKKLDNEISSTFHRPTSHIPDDIKDSFKKSAEEIKAVSEQIMESDYLKPHEKVESVKDISISGTKVASKKVASETGKKATREFLKNVIKATAPYSYAIIAGIIVFIGIFVIILAIMIACSGSAAGAEGSTQPENMTESYSITSEYFYGTRSVYIDDSALISALQQSYKQYVIDIITDIETDNPSIDITLEIPEIDEETKEPKPLGEVSATHYNNMSIAIGNIVASNSNNYTGISFETLYPQIAYFGLTESQVSSTNDFLTKYFTDNNLVILGESGKTIDQLIDEAIADEKLQYILNICEKVMLKDEIATENGIEGIQQRNYLASIYMPNSNITITGNSVCVATTTPENTINFSSIIKTGETFTELSHASTLDDGKNLIDPIDGSSKTLSKFTAIDGNNAEALSSEVSLFEAIRLLSADLFTKNDNNIYTWMPTIDNFMYLEFEGSSPFIFTDWKMDVITAESNIA